MFRLNLYSIYNAQWNDNISMPKVFTFQFVSIQRVSILGIRPFDLSDCFVAFSVILKVA